MDDVDEDEEYVAVVYISRVHSNVLSCPPTTTQAIPLSSKRDTHSPDSPAHNGTSRYTNNDRAYTSFVEASRPIAS